jgi:hypothetical protein
MKASHDVVFATYSQLPDGDPDDLLALAFLEAKGLRTAVVDWRTVTPDQLDSRLVVLRSTWDYHHYYREFLDWVDVVASRTGIRNSPDLIHWNANKKYLLDLKQRGLSIVPTLFIGREEASQLDSSSLLETLAGLELAGQASLVVKPAVGLSTFGVKRFSTSDQVEEICGHVFSLSRSSDVLIQPYLSAVEAEGEHALVFIDGLYSHAVSKMPFQYLAVAGEAGEKGLAASDEEIAFGQNVLSQLPGLCGSKPLYARVDVVHNDQGRLVLMELELIEPSLFLACDANAGARFAEAIEATLN